MLSSNAALLCDAAVVSSTRISTRHEHHRVPSGPAALCVDSTSRRTPARWTGLPGGRPARRFVRRRPAECHRLRCARSWRRTNALPVGWHCLPHLRRRIDQRCGAWLAGKRKVRRRDAGRQAGRQSLSSREERVGVARSFEVLDRALRRCTCCWMGLGSTRGDPRALRPAWRLQHATAEGGRGSNAWHPP